MKKHLQTRNIRLSKPRMINKQLCVFISNPEFACNPCDTICFKTSRFVKGASWFFLDLTSRRDEIDGKYGTAASLGDLSLTMLGSATSPLLEC